MSGIMAWGNPPPAPDPRLDRNGCYPGRGIDSDPGYDPVLAAQRFNNASWLGKALSHPAFPSTKGRPRSINTQEVDAQRRAEMAAQRQRALDLVAAKATAARAALVASIKAAAATAAVAKPKPIRRPSAPHQRPVFVVGVAKPPMRLTRKLSTFRPPKEPR